MKANAGIHARPHANAAIQTAFCLLAALLAAPCFGQAIAQRTDFLKPSFAADPSSNASFSLSAWLADGFVGTSGTQTISGAKTMSALTATGGTINGMVIGGSVPAAGTFTTLLADTSLRLFDAGEAAYGTLTHSGGVYTLRDSAAALANLTLGSITISTDLSIQQGGTGVSTLPSGLLKGAGTGAITAAVAGTDYQDADADLVDLADGSLTGSKVSGAVVVSGGTVNASVIGGITPASGTFTTLLADTSFRLFDPNEAGYGTLNHSGGVYTLRDSASDLANLTLGSITISTDLSIEQGGTGSSTTAGARVNLGVSVRTISIVVMDPTTVASTGDGKRYFVVPASMDTAVITSVRLTAITAGTTGTTDVQVARIRSGTPVDTLSTKVTLDSTEASSSTAVAPAVINASNDDLATDDLLRVDIDAVSTTPPQGLILTIEVTK